jgi:hypothetical protein
MTLAAADQMRRSSVLKGRIESSAYAKGQTAQWVDTNLAAVVAQDPTWATNWATGFDTYNLALTTGNMTLAQVFNTLGADTSVIADDAIDAQVQAVIDAGSGS